MNDPDCSALTPATTTTKGISAGGAWAALQAASLFGGRRLEGMTDDQMDACATMDICSQLMMCKNEMFSGLYNTTMDMDTTTEAEAPTTTEAEAPTTTEAEAPTTSENVIFSGLFN